MIVEFIGSTGAGKTTIFNLLNRFYDLQEGEILIDDIPITKIKTGELRRQLCVIQQEPHLFSMSLKDNICFGEKDAKDEKIIRSLVLSKAKAKALLRPLIFSG